MILNGSVLQQAGASCIVGWWYESSDCVHHMMTWFWMSSYDDLMMYNMDNGSCLLQCVILTTWINNYQAHIGHWHSRHMQSSMLSRGILFQNKMSQVCRASETPDSTSGDVVVSGEWWVVSGECARRPGHSLSCQQATPRLRQCADVTQSRGRKTSCTDCSVHSSDL